MQKKGQKSENAIKFAKKYGMIRVRDAIQAGIHPETLRRLCEKGHLIKMARGIYVPADSEISPNIGLAQVAKRVPHGVICLLSALQFHDIGTQSPFEVWIAIDPKAAAPQIDYPPVRVVRFSGEALSQGTETHQIEGVRAKIFKPAKTIVDCFKYRNKIGLDIALEALKDCRRRKLCTNDQLWKYAKICRVSNVMKPYLEAIL
ncbi:MAG: type IV toxin-antitoxin system AbiEi family antitoxin domain-containing protein [Sedimentisphaerales bacterium]|nr:type IV toxin-antitoxin system AbiEi family antitoxin domain-containing protein [Sedimentisphaerales bacterium]